MERIIWHSQRGSDDTEALVTHLKTRCNFHAGHKFTQQHTRVGVQRRRPAEVDRSESEGSRSAINIPFAESGQLSTVTACVHGIHCVFLAVSCVLCLHNNIIN